MDAASPDPALANAVVAIRSLFSAAATSCALTSQDGERLRFVASDGAGAAKIIGVEMPAGRGIAGFVAMSGQAIAVADVARDPRFARDIAESTDYVPRSIVAVPVIASDGEVAGVLSVLDPAVDASAGWALSVLGSFGTMLGRLLERPTHPSGEPGSPAPDLAAALDRMSGHGRAGEQLAAEVLGAVATFLDESDR